MTILFAILFFVFIFSFLISTIKKAFQGDIASIMGLVAAGIWVYFCYTHLI